MFELSRKNNHQVNAYNPFMDMDEFEKNFSSLKIEVGDEITVEGPVAYYNGNPQLKNVTVVKIKKSLIKIDDNKTTVSKDGGEIAVRVAYKGKGVFPAIPEDCDWIEYVGMEYKNGVPTKLEQSPADTAIVKFSVAANEGNNREPKVFLMDEPLSNLDAKLRVQMRVEISKLLLLGSILKQYFRNVGFSLNDTVAVVDSQFAQLGEVERSLISFEQFRLGLAEVNTVREVVAQLSLQLIGVKSRDDLRVGEGRLFSKSRLDVQWSHSAHPSLTDDDVGLPA